MTKYLTKIKTKVDHIAASRFPISTEDIIYYALNGLLHFYQSFKIAIYTNLHPLSLDNLYFLLYIKETIQLSEVLKLEISVPIALTANHGFGHARTSHHAATSNYDRRSPSCHGRGHNNLVECQIYEKFDHSIFNCCHHANLEFNPKPKTIKANTSNLINSDWLLDTRSSTHLSNHPSHLHDLTP